MMVLWEVVLVTTAAALVVVSGLEQGHHDDVNTVLRQDDLDAAGNLVNLTVFSKITEKEIGFDHREAMAERKKICKPTILCSHVGGYCVKSPGKCNGKVDPHGCRGRKKCMCCIPDQTTPAPPTCPVVTCAPTEGPTTAPTEGPTTARPTEGPPTGTDDVIYTFINRCTQDLWMGGEGRSNSRPSFVFNGLNFFVPNNGGWHLPAGATSQVSVPHDFTAGRFWARTGCTGTPHVDFHCETGDCGPWIECATGNIPRGGAPPVTLAEFTLNANNKDYFDISLVDGFNLPMTIHPVTYDASQPNPDGYWCTSPECLFDINSICPPELAVSGSSGTVACNSACMKFNTDEYCCRGACCGLPTTCTADKWPVNYPNEVFKAHCPQAYSYAYDDPTSTFFCRNTNYDIYFC